VVLVSGQLQIWILRALLFLVRLEDSPICVRYLIWYLEFNELLDLLAQTKHHHKTKCGISLFKIISTVA
jgi:hypothetical protein